MSPSTAKSKKSGVGVRLTVDANNNAYDGDTDIASPGENAPPPVPYDRQQRTQNAPLLGGGGGNEQQQQQQDKWDMSSNYGAIPMNNFQPTMPPPQFAPPPAYYGGPPPAPAAPNGYGGGGPSPTTSGSGNPIPHYANLWASGYVAQPPPQGMSPTSIPRSPLRTPRGQQQAPPPTLSTPEHARQTLSDADLWAYSPEDSPTFNATTTTTSSSPHHQAYSSMEMSLPFDAPSGPPTGYGSIATSTTTTTTTTMTAAQQPQTAPLLSSSRNIPSSPSQQSRHHRSNRSDGNIMLPPTHHSRSLLRRISSGGDLSQQQQPQHYHSTGSLPRTHRRTFSDGMAKRSSTRPPFIPPSNKLKSPRLLHPLHRQSSGGGGRPRTLSASSLGGASGSGSGRPRHRRADSASSIASVLSERSVVSDISRSALYKEVTDSGIIRLHLPIDNVRLVMDDGLESGVVYQNSMTFSDLERYLEYHLRSDSDGAAEYLLDPMIENGGGGCGCACDSCLRCHQKQDQLLPPTCYALAVDEDLYKRVLEEIADAKQMPCGLFFCGHHEDVHRPSIYIAVCIVAAVLVAMFIVTFFVPGN